MRKSLSGRAGTVTAVILAAGESSRLGRPKQLLRLGTETLLIRSARNGRQASSGRLVIVVGSGRLRLRSVLRRHAVAADVVVNPAWREGLASSLRAGIRRVAPDSAAALILLVDQARVSAADLDRLVRRWRRRPDRAAAASYAGRTGAPAIIPRPWFARVMRLRGDAGARRLLAGAATITRVPVPAAAFDVDTPADALALRDRGPPRA